MNKKYEDLKFIKQDIEKQFPYFCQQFFNIAPDDLVTSNGIRFKKDNTKEIKNLKNTIKSWEKEIQEYHNSIKDYFELDGFEFYEDDLDDFKNNAVAKQLWTVKSALNTRDPDLENYQKDFANATPKSLYITIKNILSKSYDYVENVKLSYSNIKSLEDLKLNFLEQDETFLIRVIGLGIRSEILHRMFPNRFVLMTRKSIWAMYFLSNEANEFVRDEIEEDMLRTTHEWEYDYIRFTYYINFLTNLLDSYLRKYDIILKPELRFGYSNMFLSEIVKSKKNIIDQFLHRKVLGF